MPSKAPLSFAMLPSGICLLLATNSGSTRSGFPMGLQQSFGVARRELKQGRNWWELWRENQGRGGDRKIELRGDGGQRGGPDHGAPAGFA